MAAGVQKATLYSYFSGKSGLIDAVVDKLLYELPRLRSADDSLPLRAQLLEIALQLQSLAAHSATISATIRCAEQRLSVKQLDEWHARYEEFESFLTRLFELQSSCEQPERIAQQFVLLILGHLHMASLTGNSVLPGVANAVELILHAYPGLVRQNMAAKRRRER